MNYRIFETGCLRRSAHLLALHPRLEVVVRAPLSLLVQLGQVSRQTGTQRRVGRGDAVDVGEGARLRPERAVTVLALEALRAHVSVFVLQHGRVAAEGRHRAPRGRLVHERLTGCGAQTRLAVGVRLAVAQTLRRRTRERITVALEQRRAVVDVDVRLFHDSVCKRKQTSHFTTAYVRTYTSLPH